MITLGDILFAAFVLGIVSAIYWYQLLEPSVVML